MDFSFLNDIIQSLLKFIPRPVIVRLTHGGVKWRFGRWAKEMKPGFHIVWPLVTDWEVIVTARQTHHLATQSLVTKDGKQIAVGTLIVYSVRDIMKAIAERNWDTDSLVNDISLAVVVDEITKLMYDDLHQEIADRVAYELTQKCRKQLRQYGVYVHRVRLTEIAPVRTLKILGFEKMYSQTNPSHISS
jgi:regulator of protease activity HflC (stomatin/prohibitin superfamily)